MRHLFWICFLLVPTFAVTARPLTVCARPNAGFLTEEAGEIRGLEHDLLSRFATSRSRELKILWMKSFGEVMPGALQGRCDLASSAITVTPERARQVEFSRAYFPNRALLASRRGAHFQTMDDLRGKTVAAVSGTHHYELVSAIEGAKVHAVDSDETLFRALQEGTADAAACDSATLVPALERFPDLEASLPLSELSAFAFAFPPGSELRIDFDRFFTQLVEDGEWARLLESYFGTDGAALILEMLAEATEGAATTP